MKPSNPGPVVELLQVIDATVHADGAYAALEGRVAIAVERASSAQWWVADFSGQHVETFLSDEPPQEVPHAALLVGSDSAARMMRGDLDADLETAVLGDQALLQRFVARYFSQTKGLNQQMLRFASVPTKKARLS